MEPVTTKELVNIAGSLPIGASVSAKIQDEKGETYGHTVHKEGGGKLTEVKVVKL